MSWIHHRNPSAANAHDVGWVVHVQLSAPCPVVHVQLRTRWPCCTCTTVGSGNRLRVPACRAAAIAGAVEMVRKTAGHSARPGTPGPPVGSRHAVLSPDVRPRARRCFLRRPIEQQRAGHWPKRVCGGGLGGEGTEAAPPSVLLESVKHLKQGIDDGLPQRIAGLGNLAFVHVARGQCQVATLVNDNGS